MANRNLVALKPMLLAMDAAIVTEPDIPAAVELQEATDLAQLTGNPEVAAALMKVGLPKSSFEKLEVAIDAARAAQSEWAVTRDRSKSEARVNLEREAYALRTSTVAACRWSLRADRVAMATLAAIADGEGVEDLVQDLVNLAELMDRRAAAFDGDQTFDAKAKAKEARNLSAKIRKGVSATRSTTEQAESKSLRDRAFTHLHALLNEIREAGRYAYLNDDVKSRGFVSAYRCRHRSKAPASPSTPAVPPIAA